MNLLIDAIFNSNLENMRVPYLFHSLWITNDRKLNIIIKSKFPLKRYDLDILVSNKATRQGLRLRMSSLKFLLKSSLLTLRVFQTTKIVSWSMGLRVMVGARTSEVCGCVIQQGLIISAMITIFLAISWFTAGRSTNDHFCRLLEQLWTYSIGLLKRIWM